MSEMTENELKTLFTILNKNWQLLKKNYPDEERPLTDEEWQAVVNQQAEYENEIKTEWAEDNAKMIFARDLSRAVAIYFQNRDALKKGK